MSEFAKKLIAVSEDLSFRSILDYFPINYLVRVFELSQYVLRIWGVT